MDRVLPEHLAGQKLSALESDGKVRLVAVTRAGVPRLDTSGLVGQDGDLLHLVVMKDDLPALEALLATPSPSRWPSPPRRADEGRGRGRRQRRHGRRRRT